jgi:hypothetical protein
MHVNLPEEEQAGDQVCEEHFAKVKIFSMCNWLLNISLLFLDGTTSISLSQLFLH